MLTRARAPLRISFAGGGTDVPPFCELEGGATLSTTIDRYTYGSLRPRDDGHITIESVDLGLNLDYEAGMPLQTDEQLALVKAAILRVCPPDCGGFDLVVRSPVPPGSGLGSSSALVVTLVSLLQRHYRLALTTYEIADLAHEIERIDLGIAGGYQDQYAATFGGFNYIEFGTKVVVNSLRIQPDIISELELSLMLCYTGITRESHLIIEDQTGRAERCEPDTLSALREQKELATAMKTVLLRGDLASFAELLDAAWSAKKRLSPLISNAIIDEAYESARRAGALGGKVTGAGGGGYLLIMSDVDNRHRVAEAVERLGLTTTDIAFTPHGVTSWQI